jgi:hypothetical protein
MEVAICTGRSVRDLSMLDVYADRAAIAKAAADRVSPENRTADEHFVKVTGQAFLFRLPFI